MRYLILLPALLIPVMLQAQEPVFPEQMTAAEIAALNDVVQDRPRLVLNTDDNELNLCVNDGTTIECTAVVGTASAAPQVTPPFVVSGNGDTANANSNQLVASFSVPQTGSYVGTTDLFHSYSTGAFSRTSHGLGVVKQGDSITVAANRLFYQYWQRDNPAANTQYNLVTQGFVNSAQTNPHAAITLEAGVTYQLWRISNTGQFRDGDSVQVTFTEVAISQSIDPFDNAHNTEFEVPGETWDGKQVFGRVFNGPLSDNVLNSTGYTVFPAGLASYHIRQEGQPLDRRTDEWVWMHEQSGRIRIRQLTNSNRTFASGGSTTYYTQKFVFYYIK